MKYRLGKKQKRAILDENGLEVALLPKGQEKQAEDLLKVMNGVPSNRQIGKYLLGKLKLDGVLITTKPSNMSKQAEEFVKTKDQEEGQNWSENTKTLIGGLQDYADQEVAKAITKLPKSPKQFLDERGTLEVGSTMYNLVLTILEDYAKTK